MHPAGSPAKLTASHVRQVVGEVEDAVVARIIATGASPAELVEAYQWLMADETFSDAPRPVTGPVRQVYEILESELPPTAEDR